MKKEFEVDQDSLNDSDGTKKTSSKEWKFYNAMLFMKKDIEEDLEKERAKGEKEITNEEKATVIEFYKNTPHLWDASLKEYRDRDQRRASMERLSKELDDKYTVKDLAETWHKLSTHFQRESVKQESSLKSGAGKEDVYESDWPFFSSLKFIKDKTEPEKGVSNTFDHVAPLNDKKTPTKRKREEEKENSMEITKMKVLEALLSRLSDNKGTTSGGMSWKNGYEAGFQAGFQQGIALCSQLQIQQAQPKPPLQSLYPSPLQHTVPFSSLPATYISQNLCHEQQKLGETAPSTSQDNTEPPLKTIDLSEIDWNL